MPVFFLQLLILQAADLQTVYIQIYLQVYSKIYLNVYLKVYSKVYIIRKENINLL